MCVCECAYLFITGRDTRDTDSSLTSPVFFPPTEAGSQYATACQFLSNDYVCINSQVYKNQYCAMCNGLTVPANASFDVSSIFVFVLLVG